jgi:hypothetical protein
MSQRLPETFSCQKFGYSTQFFYLSKPSIRAVGKAGTFDWVVTDDSEFKYESKFIGPLVSWYSEFVSKKLSLPGVCYSSSRLGFVSRTGLAFRAEFYSDIDELKALARIVGPYGIRLIDREILKHILFNATGIKVIILFWRFFLTVVGCPCPQQTSS